MSLNTRTPPLLLTKRLTSFLNANLSPSLHAAFLSTPSGKLLAHATTPGASSLQTTDSSSSLISPTTTAPTKLDDAHAQTSPNPRPGSVTLLRTQATVAASLYALHSASSSSIPDALPESDSDSDPAAKQNKAGAAKPLTITVQLSHGVMVIRRLKCGLLFVCVGPLGDGLDPSTHHAVHSGQTPSESPGAAANHGLSVPGTATPKGHGQASPAHMPASPSGDSVLSTGGVTTASIASVGSSVAGSVGTAAVVSLRRHAEDLARWLDDKLGTLRVPEEGVGVE